MTSANIPGALKPAPIFEQLGIEEGMKVAELGCGSGFFSLGAARIVGDTGIVYAVDILKPALAAIESKARNEGLYNIKTVWSNLEIVGATKIMDSLLDYVFVFNVLFQAEKKEELLREASRMLRPGGRLAVIDWSEPVPGVPVCVPLEKVREMAAAVGLETEREFEVDSTHYGMVFKK